MLCAQLLEINACALSKYFHELLLKDLGRKSFVPLFRVINQMLIFIDHIPTRIK